MALMYALLAFLLIDSGATAGFLSGAAACLLPDLEEEVSFGSINQ